MTTENDKIVKLLESKSRETQQILDKINKSIKDFNKSYLNSFKYPDELLSKLSQISDLINCPDKTSDEIISEIKKILC